MKNASEYWVVKKPACIGNFPGAVKLSEILFQSYVENVFCRQKFTLAMIQGSDRNVCPKLVRSEIKSVRKLNVPNFASNGTFFLVLRQ